MNSDIRIPVSFINNIKRMKLSKALDVPDCAGFLLDLWLHVSMDRPKGVLYNMDETDIAFYAGWRGDEHAFVAALMKCGFLEQDEDGNYVIHEWEEHQGYAAHASERSEQAKQAANQRWGRKKGKAAKTSKAGDDADLCEQQCSQHESALLNLKSSNAPSPTPSPTPSPDPNPSPKPEGHGEIVEPEATAVPQEKILQTQDPDFDAFWNAYPEERRLEQTEAHARFRSIVKGGASPAAIATAARNYAAYCRKYVSEAKYIKHPTSFLGAVGKQPGPWHDFARGTGPPDCGPVQESEWNKISMRNWQAKIEKVRQMESADKSGGGGNAGNSKTGNSKTGTSAGDVRQKTSGSGTATP